MRKSFIYLLATIVFALSLIFSQSSNTRTAQAADINEKCNDCLAKVARQYDQCVAQHGETPACGEKANQDVIHCYRNFCEQ